MMINELTAEQDSVIRGIADDTIDTVLSLGKALDLDTVVRWLSVVYCEIYSAPVPQVTVCDSPMAALELAGRLTGEICACTDRAGVADVAWLSRCMAFRAIGALSDAEVTEASMAMAYSLCVWDSVLLDEMAIVIRYPTSIRLVDSELHSADGMAIRFADGYGEYFWHGVCVDERLIMQPESYTADEIRAITDTEYRRALGERLGWDVFTRTLGATCVDVWVDKNTGLRYELLRTDLGQWLSKESPCLQDGRRPVYVEPVHEDIRTAAAARKWQATRMSAGECEADPTLSYCMET